MEFGGIKKGRKRKRRNRVNNKRRDTLRFEHDANLTNVKFLREVFDFKLQDPIFLNYDQKRKKRRTKMDANAFWENYKAAHEWQNKHNVTWWKTRCFALEHENHVLKETIRNLVQNQHNNHFSVGTSHTEQRNVVNTENCSDEDDAEDHLEFHLDEDMMNFLAQSIRHKIELKNKKESEATDINEITDGKIDNVPAMINKRSEDAKLLYGESSSRVLAMETALQATMDRHIDKAKPQYWPNIPLKL